MSYATRSLVLAFVAAPAPAQELLWRRPDIGGVVRITDDLDGDGVRDALLLRHEHTTASGYRWIVEGIAGTTGATLWSETSAWGRFVPAIAALGDDVDGDGVDDFVMVHDDLNWFTPDYLEVRSGADRSVLASRVVSMNQVEEIVLESASDLDGDGVRDLLYSDRWYKPEAAFYSSATLAKLHSTQALTLPGSDNFAAAVEIGDLDGDAVRDFALSSPGNGQGSSTGWVNGGYVHAFSTATGALIQSIQGASKSSFGELLHRVDDLDGDGVTDFAVMADREAANGMYDVGVAHVYSGQTFAELQRIEGGPSRKITRTDPAGDYDGDGFGDLLINHVPNANHDGGWWIYSGRTRSQLHNVRTVEGGPTIAAAADLDGDGFGDLVMQIPHYVVGGPRIDAFRGGSAFLSSYPATVKVASPPPPGQLRSPKYPPGFGGGQETDRHSCRLRAAGFLPGTWLTIDVVAIDGVAVSQPVFAGFADAVGAVETFVPFVMSEPAVVELRATGTDYRGVVLTTPAEVVTFVQ